MSTAVQRPRTPHPSAAAVDPGNESADVPRTDLHTQVLERVGDAVLSGSWPGGAVFRTEDLAADMGVSLSVVREAVRVAASLGLVASRKRVGVQVLDSSQWLALDPRVLRWQAVHHAPAGPPGPASSVLSVLVGLAPAGAAAGAVVARDEEVVDISAASVAVVALPRAASLASLVTTVVEAAHDPVFTAVSDMAKAVDAWGVVSGVVDSSGATALAVAIQRADSEAAQRAMHLLVAPVSGLPLR